MATIRLEQLTKRFDEVVAVDDLTVTFEQGSTTCLLGPSGCGKTTLMRMIAGLDAPTSGRIHFDDREVTTVATRDRNLGMVFQYPVVYRGTTVRDNVALPLRREAMSSGERAERVDEVLALVGLDRSADHDVSKLDNASRQKVAVARAIVRRPPVVLFDEPITNVDITSKLQLKRVLKELFTRLEQTVLYVTHDQTEAMTLADNIALMRDGRIEQLASPRDLYDRAESVFAGWFLGTPGMNFVKRADAPEMIDRLLGHERAAGVVTIGFRPEHVEIVPDDDPAAVQARVRHVSMATGGQLLVAVTVKDRDLKAKLPAGTTHDLAVGSDVSLRVRPDRIRTFDHIERFVGVAS